MITEDRCIQKLLDAELLGPDGLDLSKLADNHYFGNKKSEAYAVWALLWETARRYNATYCSDSAGPWLFIEEEDYALEIEFIVQTVLREWSGSALKWLPKVIMPDYHNAPARVGALDNRHDGVLPWLNKQHYARAQIVYKGFQSFVCFAGDWCDWDSGDWLKGRRLWNQGHVGPLFRAGYDVPLVAGPTSVAPVKEGYRPFAEGDLDYCDPHEPYDVHALVLYCIEQSQAAFVRYLVEPLPKEISVKRLAPAPVSPLAVASAGESVGGPGSAQMHDHTSQGTTAAAIVAHGLAFVPLFPTTQATLRPKDEVGTTHPHTANAGMSFDTPPHTPEQLPTMQQSVSDEIQSLPPVGIRFQPPHDALDTPSSSTHTSFGTLGASPPTTGITGKSRQPCHKRDASVHSSSSQPVPPPTSKPLRKASERAPQEDASASASQEQPVATREPIFRGPFKQLDAQDDEATSA